MRKQRTSLEAMKANDAMASSSEKARRLSDISQPGLTLYESKSVSNVQMQAQEEGMRVGRKSNEGTGTITPSKSTDTHARVPLELAEGAEAPEDSEPDVQ